MAHSCQSTMAILLHGDKDSRTSSRKCSTLGMSLKIGMSLGSEWSCIGNVNGGEIGYSQCALRMHLRSSFHLRRRSCLQNWYCIAVAFAVFWFFIWTCSQHLIF